MDGCKHHDSKEHDQAKTEQDASVTSSLGKIRNKFLVMSGKGGVGKTSVAVNLSIALAKKGFTVGLMDVDIHGPDVPRMLGLGGMAGMSDNKLAPMIYSENLKVISIESLIPDKDEAIIWRGPMKHSLIRQFVGDVDWGDLDYLIIDSPPGTGDEPLSVAQTIPDARAVIVTTPQEISLADVRKSINFCKAVKMEIFGLIENMSGLICPGCGERIDLFGSGGGEKTAVAAGIPFLGRIPLDPNMVSCGDFGLCFQEKYKESPAALAFSEIAEKMSPEVKSAIETKESAEPKRRNSNMKFAIPLAEGKLTAHFGHCQEFALIEVEGNQILNKEVLQPPPHEPGVIPKWLHELQTNVIIAGGMGSRAIGLFDQYGIKVVTGAPVELPEALIRSYLDNALVSGPNVCDH
jgi:Mrp family chromosome partitioning ATPase/predicted Fe-Mo cluster-binding NifX family protein